ncbi:hypothetical protein LUZ60_001348 [Juncus effusus]|nr:hypothetical protein LUZ60_001348 [Juncus effusus]
MAILMAKSLCLVILSLLGLSTIAAGTICGSVCAATGTPYVGPGAGSGTGTVGTAAYYTAPYTPSQCYGYTDEGTMIAAASDPIWDNGAACGRMYTIKCNSKAGIPCTGATVTVKVVDYCEKCNYTFYISQEAFQKLSTNLDVGTIKIYYNRTQEIPFVKAQLIYCPEKKHFHQYLRKD